MECPICIEPYKGKKVVKVTCQYCPSNACRGCQQRYLLQTYEDPHCMECKRGWSSEFMAANFPLVFRNDTLRKHRRKVLCEREKAMLPAMQIYVEHRRESDRLAAETEVIKKILFDKSNGKCLSELYYDAKDDRRTAIERLVSLKNQINEHKAIIETMTASKTATDTLVRTEEDILIALRASRKAIKDELDNTTYPGGRSFQEFTEYVTKQRFALQTLGNQLWQSQMRYEDRWRGGGAAAAAETRREFIMKCPDEGCRGFLSSAYKCGTCAKFTCAQCLVVLGESKPDSHTCNPDAVETAKTIKAETRPCPKCGTRIFKIDGCDQMWCVMDGCHTAFSWNTGHIVTGVVHNPHYYEWLRRAGGGAAPAREAGDIPCGGLPNAWQLQANIRHLQLPNDTVNSILETHRNLRELIDYRLREFPARPPAGMNKDNDVAYLMNRVTEEEWRRQLEFAEARFRRKKEIGQILQMLSTAGSDAFTRMLNRVIELDDNTDQATDWVVSMFMPEMEGLREYGNDAFKSLAKREHMAVPQLGPDWKWMPIRALYRTVVKKAKKGEAAAPAAPAAVDDTPLEEIIDLTGPEVNEIVTVV